MAELNSDQRKLVSDLIARAGLRLDGAAAAASRRKVTEGEFDNNFDGVVTAIFHVVEAVEISRHGRMRAFGEGGEFDRDPRGARRVVGRRRSGRAASQPSH